MTATLKSLYTWLDNLHGRPEDQALEGALAGLDFPEEEIQGITFPRPGVRRLLLRSGQLHLVWLMAWKPGQCSPIHDHGSSVCGIAVVRGEMTRTRFLPGSAGKLRACEIGTFSPGAVCLAKDHEWHQVANRHPRLELLTLHVYTPPLVNLTNLARWGAHEARDALAEALSNPAWPENAETPLANVQHWVTPNWLGEGI